MSLYNTLFGVNDRADILLTVLGLRAGDIPRFRDCFLRDNTILIHTRTGGGNRAYYENEKTCRENYPDYFTGEPSEHPQPPWNDDLRKHPNYLTDVDDAFDCTYANFYFSFPDEFKTELAALSRGDENIMPSEKWKILFKTMDATKCEPKE
jgi:hypothetical protein